MSKYVNKLLEYYKQNPDVIQPTSAWKEVIEKSIRSAARDVQIRFICDFQNSTSNFYDGNKESHWFESLLSYITQTGFDIDDLEPSRRLTDYCPTKIYFSWQDTLRFHTIYLPIILMALDMPLPNRTYIKNLFQIKSCKPNGERKDFNPLQLIEYYGKDAFRFLIVKLVSEQRKVLSLEDMTRQYNMDLVEGLDQLISRIINMLDMVGNRSVPRVDAHSCFDTDLRQFVSQSVKNIEWYMDNIEFSQSLSAISSLIKLTNQYICESTPGYLFEKNDTQQLQCVLYYATELIRIISILLQPFMPEFSKKIFSYFKWDSEETSWNSSKYLGLGKPKRIEKEKITLFPRIPQYLFQ